MAFPCRDENCKKSFSTKYNRNKHEKRKGHGPQLQGKPKILPTENLYYCPTYKANIVEHLKLCVESKEKQNTAAKKNMPDFPESLSSKMEPRQTRAKCSPKLGRRHCRQS